ncbi:MgtC/SapB family protein [Nodosilinea sp. FACHB-131]|uniref:MgtC/SapB family protein n=1 Tax=Cyanophyceae TaxID=3028117 RepID=UPI0016847EE2|nr:MgtC/SapB family protein [Nodosilinea sp. FACHB-131]MBD1872906.1 MgtC/SapB family protein [Nodosilinea sp. FACHB-131]
MIPLSPISWIDVTGRLAVAVALGTVIGIDREFSRKAAGLRTNMLVSLGAALFVLVTIQSGMAQVDNSAMGRILQGIITGVGFVGAGTIFREDRVRGLTSATAIWVSAGAGVAAGLGLWQLGLLSTGFALIILRLVKFIESRV